MQVRARRADRAARFPGAPREVVERDGESVGALLLAEDRLVDLHLLARARARGTGTAVLVELVRRAGAAGRPLRLRTRRDNAAMLAAAARAGFVRAHADELDVELERRP